MLVTKSSEYALIAVAHIVLSKAKNPVKISEVSDTYGISYGYLNKTIQQLVKENILISKRGSNGGLKLARPVKEITMLDIIEAIDGPLDSRHDISHYTEKNPYSTKIENIYKDACNQAKRIFDNAKLSQIIKKTIPKVEANLAKKKSKKVIEIKSVPRKDKISKELLERIENSKKEREQERIHTKKRRGRIYTKENIACIYELSKMGKCYDEIAQICDYVSGKAVGQAVRHYEKQNKI